MPQLEIFNSAQAQPEIYLNRNSSTLEHQAVYGRNQQYTGPLIWGWWGGRWSGFLVNAGYATLAASATNYMVVLRSTGAVSVSAVITNWNDATLYARVYLITTNATTIASFEDHRVGVGGVLGSAAGGGGLSSPVGIVDGGTGATTAAGARTNLVAAKSGANTDINTLERVWGPATAHYENTAIGMGALQFNTSAIYNVAIGQYALQGATTGSNNTAVGPNALYTCTTGSGNVALGYGALQGGTAVYECIAIGNAVMQANPGVYTIGIGSNANAGAGPSSSNNVAVGCYSLSANVSGVGNTALGYEAGNAVTGGKNTFLGWGAGKTATTGSNNTIVGNLAAPSAVTVSNEITLGNASIATLRCQVTSITALSDARDKTDIQSLTFGLDFINALKPVSFIWNARDGSKVGKAASGFLAQDLAHAEEAFGAQDVLDLVSHNDPDRLEARYGHLIPVLVRAVQELSARIAVLEHGRDTKFNQEKNT